MSAPVATEPEAATPAEPAPGPAAPLAGKNIEDAERMLTDVANQRAKAFQPTGIPAVARFDEQQEYQQPIQIDPGGCYAVVAYGTVSLYDVRVVVEMSGLPPISVLSMEVDKFRGAAGGTADTCWKTPYPTAVPGKLVLRARNGTGFIAARVYRS